MPTAVFATPSAWITLACLPIDLGTVAADRSGFSAVALEWSHELDLAVAVPVVVPVHKRTNPLARGLLTGESSAGIISPIFGRVTRDSELVLSFDSR